jgi:hypothetical protein
MQHKIFSEAGIRKFAPITHKNGAKGHVKRLRTMLHVRIEQLYWRFE